MAKLSRKDIADIRESIRVGSFCNKWWKQLSKELKVAKIDNSKKVQVFEKIIEGLINEGLALCETEDKKQDFRCSIEYHIAFKMGEVVFEGDDYE